ncbi:MAG TPA: polyhydroxyalkanoate depolymerase [Dongiaceae bacterium]|nr:polyhydroxyalkanoate depolymerase [Dongiaceae bacterium]
MLYQAIEAHLASLTPARLTARWMHQMMSHPMLPCSYTTGCRAAAAWLELFDRATQRRAKPAFGLHETEITGERAAVCAAVVAEKPFCRLLHFARDLKRPRHDPRVLVVAPMSGHHASLLRGTVETLLPAHEVCVTDWADARLVPLSAGNFDLADYIDYIVAFLRILGPQTHVLAVCQPSPPVLAAAALMAAAGDPAAPKSLTLMGGPVDTRLSPTAVNRVGASQSLDWFERKVIDLVPPHYPGAMRRVYPGFLQLGGFMSMNPDRHVRSHIDFFHHLVVGDGESAAAHRRFYDEYLSVMDLSADFYLDTIRHVFQEHSLARGVFRHRGEKVEPAAIRRTALMTIEGELDDISGLGQTKAAHDLCRGIPAARRRHLEQEGVGHYGIFNGRKWRQSIYPAWAEFVRRA